MQQVETQEDKSTIAAKIFKEKYITPYKTAIGGVEYIEIDTEEIDKNMCQFSYLIGKEECTYVKVIPKGYLGAFEEALKYSRNFLNEVLAGVLNHNFNYKNLKNFVYAIHVHFIHNEKLNPKSDFGKKYKKLWFLDEAIENGQLKNKKHCDLVIEFSK